MKTIKIMYIMKTEKTKDPNVSLEEARKECETHIEIMEKLNKLECYFKTVCAEDYDGIFYYDELVNNMLRPADALQIAKRQKHDEILLMIKKYGQMYQTVREHDDYSHAPVLSDDVQVIIAQRNNAQEMHTYLAYLGFGEPAQHIIVDRGDHDELMYYIERHGFVPEVQKKLWERGNRDEISLHFRKHGLCPELVSEYFKHNRNHDDLLFIIHHYGQQHKALPDDVQVIIAQCNDTEEIRTYLSYMGFGGPAQDVVVSRGNHDELMYYIERHGFVPEVQKKLWARGNKEEISLHLLKHGLCSELEAELLDDGNPENFKFWVSRRYLSEERQKKLLESGSSEIFYAYIARHDFSYCFEELLIEKRSTQEIMDYISMKHRLNCDGVRKLLERGDHNLIMHYISFLEWPHTDPFIREFNLSGRKNDEELIAAYKRQGGYAYLDFQKSLIEKGDASAFAYSLDGRLDPGTEKFLAQKGSHDIVMAYIERYPLEMYALREFFNRNNSEEAVFYCQKWQ